MVFLFFIWQGKKATQTEAPSSNSGPLTPNPLLHNFLTPDNTDPRTPNPLLHTAPTAVNSGPSTPNPLLHNFPTLEARRKAVSRWTSKFRATNLVGTLAAMVRSVAKRNLGTSMEEMGVSYTSPRKRQRCSKVRNAKDHPIDPKRRDAFSLRAKKSAQGCKEKPVWKIWDSSHFIQEETCASCEQESATVL